MNTHRTDIVWLVEHYRGDDHGFLHNSLPGSDTEDLIVGTTSEADMKKWWRTMHREEDLHLGRITRITPLDKEEVDAILQRGKWMGVTNENLLAVLESLNSRLK